jgi:hypothetical protein
MQIPRLTPAASLLEMDLFWLREVRPSALHDVPVAVVRADLLAQVSLDAVEVEWREIFAVGHRFESICVAAHSNEPLDV